MEIPKGYVEVKGKWRKGDLYVVTNESGKITVCEPAHMVVGTYAPQNYFGDVLRCFRKKSLAKKSEILTGPEAYKKPPSYTGELRRHIEECFEKGRNLGQFRENLIKRIVRLNKKYKEV